MALGEGHIVRQVHVRAPGAAGGGAAASPAVSVALGQPPPPPAQLVAIVPASTASNDYVVTTHVPVGISEGSSSAQATVPVPTASTPAQLAPRTSGARIRSHAEVLAALSQFMAECRSDPVLAEAVLEACNQVTSKMRTENERMCPGCSMTKPVYRTSHGTPRTGSKAKMFKTFHGSQQCYCERTYPRCGVQSMETAWVTPRVATGCHQKMKRLLQHSRQMSVPYVPPPGTQQETWWDLIPAQCKNNIHCPHSRPRKRGRGPPEQTLSSLSAPKAVPLNGETCVALVQLVRTSPTGDRVRVIRLNKVRTDAVRNASGESDTCRG